MKRYVIGLDYGTLSGRCLLVDADTGEELAESVLEYAHGVMDQHLPDGQPLPPQWALQHPLDYIDVLRVTIPDALQKAGVNAKDVVGVGIDFTACTWLPLDDSGVPLCLKPEWEHEKHAYVKLWKHHAAQKQADRINALAEARGEAWLRRYGGRLSSEFALPKILQILEEAPQVYQATARFTEAGDWLSFVLTGKETHSAVFAGYKACWSAEEGYPDNAYWCALDPRLDGIVGTKLSNTVLCVDQIAGYLNAQGAELTGLPVGTPLALPMIDGHAAMPALGITGERELMLVVGTSSCQFINARDSRPIDGICGFARDAVIPGYATYEAGQAGVGDIFDWFVKNGVPDAYAKEAQERGIGIHRLLRERVQAQRPGESGLLALDWLNGNRSLLNRSELSGVVLGLTLQTKLEEIYRAWLEAVAFGARMVFEAFLEKGFAVDQIIAAGGIARKDDLMMQIYADVLKRPIRIGGSVQTGALGSAIYAAVAGGVYPTVQAAAERLSRPGERVFLPQAENCTIYDRLYAEYKRLHDYFGKGENPVLFRLNAERQGAGASC